MSDLDPSTDPQDGKILDEVRKGTNKCHIGSLFRKFKNSAIYRRISSAIHEYEMIAILFFVPEGTAKPIADTQINIIPNISNVSLFLRCG